MVDIDFTHDGGLTSWVPGADGHPHFPIQNLPFGIFTPANSDVPRGGVAIGAFILDLAALADLAAPADWLEPSARSAALLAGAPTLNALFALGHQAMTALRQGLVRLLSDDGMASRLAPALHSADTCRMHLPFAIGDYTDFYTGIHHAENVGRLLRPDQPLMPNYKYVPIGYHGRASSIRLSGVDVRRPRGQIKPPDAAAPVVAPTARLDYELEMAIWVGRGNRLGEPVPIGQAARHIGGYSLLNDWSARDVQAWEYQPLGPFLAKNFQSNIAPWVVTAQALAPFRVAQAPRAQGDPAPLPYLSDAQDQAQGALAVTMEVFLVTRAMRARGLAPLRLSTGAMTNMYWTPAQLLAHHASNGCNLAPGDLLGTGTLSGREAGSWGSLMEISRGGREPLALPHGELRTFLEDGDEVILSAFAQREGFARIGFGECRARVLPAL
jgi:fumarylacetoacetase